MDAPLWHTPVCRIDTNRTAPDQVLCYSPSIFHYYCLIIKDLQRTTLWLLKLAQPLLIEIFESENGDCHAEYNMNTKEIDSGKEYNMTLVRWSPMGMDRMQHRWNRLFDEVFNGSFEDEDVQQVWRPRVDVLENESEVRVLVDLPGIRKEDVSVTLENGVLSISGERSLEEKKEEDNVHFSERVYGRFSRSFTVRETIAQDKIQATFKDGVLSLVLPKAEQAKPKKIEINAA